MAGSQGSSSTYLGNHTSAVQRGLNMGVALFIISEGFTELIKGWLGSPHT
jgi:cytochrome c oxidase subunit 3